MKHTAAAQIEFIQCEVAADATWKRVPPALESLLGMAPSDLLNQPVAHVLHPHDAPRFETTWGRLPSATDLDSRLLQLRFQRDDHSTVWCEVNLLTSAHGGAMRHWLHIRDITAQKNQAREQQQLLHSLGERLKELTLLHHLAALLHKEQQDPNRLLQDVVLLLPSAFQFHDVTVARVMVGAYQAASPNFRETDWGLRAPVRCDGGTGGTVEVYYLEERPPWDSGPFMAEETVLLESVAELLAGYFTSQQAKAELAESEQRMRIALDHIPSTFAIYDADLRFQFLNARGLGLSGRSLEALLGKTNEEALPLESISNYLPLLHKAAETLETQTAELEVQVPGGPLLTASATFVPIIGPEGKLVQVLSVSHDLTARKQAEEALRRSETQLRQLAENLPGAVYICHNDENYTVLYLSQAIEDICGYSPQEFQDGTISFGRLLLDEERQQVASTINAAVAERRSFNLRYHVRQKAGGVRLLEEYGSGIFLGDKLQALQGFLVDITERSRAEHEQEVFSTLGHQLAAADKVETVGQVLETAVSVLWPYKKFSFSVRASGEAWQREIVGARKDKPGVSVDPPCEEPFQVSKELLSGHALLGERNCAAGGGGSMGTICPLLFIPRIGYWEFYLWRPKALTDFQRPICSCSSE